jgi:hypothetical protein
VGKLADHPYKVFLTDMDLTQEVARNIAKLCNYADVHRISMDGLEGCCSTGHGDYARALFAKGWYDALSPGLRGRVANDAANPSHFNWHINSDYNWGEPWGAGFRQGMTLYRFKNQVFFERNLLPHMLGWFVLDAKTTTADIEWLLARSAGYDAGFGLATNSGFVGNQVAAREGSSPEAKRMGDILDAIREWEAARQSGAFPPELRAQLRDNNREFHLEKAGDKAWNLYPVEKDGKRGQPIQVKAAR